MATVIASAFCFAVIGTLGTLIFSGGANPITLLTGRFFVVSIMFFVTILIWDKKLFKIEREDSKRFALLGLILLAQVLTYWYGFQIVKSVAVQVGLFFTYPIWTAILMALILKYKISKKIIVCIGIGLFGVLMTLGIIPNGVSSFPALGVLLGLLTAVIWSMYYIGSQILSKNYHLLTILFYNFLLCFVGCIFLQPVSVLISQINLSVFWYILLVAFISSYLAYGFLQYAIKACGVIMVSIQNIIQPVFAIIVAFIVLQQTVSLFQVVGMGLIIFNIYLLDRWRVNQYE